MAYQILIVEDDVHISNLLARIVQEAGYQCIQAYSGTEARLRLEREEADLVLLDLMLPGMSGEEVLKELRKHQNWSVPILILSAKNSLQDKVSLLKMGADDYITKPFEPEEVIARIEASLRRVGKETVQNLLVYKNLKLYPSSRKVLIKDEELTLTAHEFDLLCLLMKHPDKVYSRESLYDQVWQGGYYGENNTVNVHISNIRKKLKEKDPDVEYIQTVYGIGFKLL